MCFSSNTCAEHHTDCAASGNSLYGTTCDSDRRRPPNGCDDTVGNTPISANHDGEPLADEYTEQTSSDSIDNGRGDRRGIFYDVKPGFCRGNFQDGLSGVSSVRFSHCSVCQLRDAQW